jgi:hypothetical protein
MSCEQCNGKQAIVQQNLEAGFKKYWRPIAAYVYLGICIFDFVGMPIIMEVQNRQVNSEAFAELRLLDDKDVRIEALKQLDLGRVEWKPLTLEGGAIFHVAFGAILGVAAWTRGAEKTAAINQGR